MKENLKEVNSNKKITYSDLRRVFLRSNFIQGSWNFERMQALGFCFSIIPVINKLYPKDNINRRNMINRHLEFFNTHPYFSSFIIGIVIAMEENSIKKKSFIDDAAIRNIKVSLMGPLAGIGDPMFWGTIRPILAAMGAGMAINGSILGPLVFFITFNLLRLTTKYLGIFYGYKKGIDFIRKIKYQTFHKIQELMSIIGLFMMGALVSKWSHINISLKISEISNLEGKKTITTIQNLLDQILPGIVPMLLTFLCMWLIRKKINSIFIILMFFFFSIIGCYLEILSL